MSRHAIIFAGALATIFLARGLNAAPSTQKVYSFEDPILNQITASSLETFESERQLRVYLSRIEQLRQSRRKQWFAGRQRREQYAQANPLPCLPDDPKCPSADDAVSDIVVTSQKASTPASITNNQTSGVDEGDIVKQIGPFLLILQDGRIFSVDTRNGMKLADRVNVYRDSNSGTWYDEMLVQDNHVLINAYSYEEEATELSIFSIDQTTGRLTSQGVFLISSSDYYDIDNYATRIVGDKLVIYTPFEPDSFTDREQRPTIRRWLPEAQREMSRAKRRGRPLFDARSIYRPVQRTAEPVIHSLSICRLGSWRPNDELDCSVTAFVGPQEAQMFVSPKEIYLWTWPGYDELGWPDDCEDSDQPNRPMRPLRQDVIPSAIFRVPLDGGEPGVVGVNGRPFDQFSMDSRDHEFRALVAWRGIRCNKNGEGSPDVAFLTLPWGSFGADFYPASDSRFTPLPGTGERIIENRFADDWLVYGGRGKWRGYPPDKQASPQQSTVVVVPVKKPKQATAVTLTHNILRIERVGNDMMLDGYRDSAGLMISLLKLGTRPKISSSVTLPKRFESEGRSHAFNSITDEHGAGVLGIPTVLREEESGRWWWHSDASDLSFVTASDGGMLKDVGTLLSRRDDHDESDEQARSSDGYKCEVSCIDWYGNSRPIFIEGRIFGLMGTELVEARIGSKGMEEVNRLDMTQSPLRP